MHTHLSNVSFLITLVLSLAVAVVLFPITAQLHVSNLGLELYSKLLYQLRSSLEDFPTTQPVMVNLQLLFQLQLLARPEAFTSVGYLPRFDL